MTLPVRLGEFGTRQPYKMSFTAGGLFLNESLALAARYLETKDWVATIALAQAEGLVSLPKENSKRRILREIVNRLETLSDDELRFLVEEADRQERVLLIWLSVCRAYRFVREFAIEVLCDRYLSYHLDLPMESFDIFFAAKADWDDGLASISDTTRNKVRQVLFRILREASLLSEDNRIQSTYLSASLRALVGAAESANLAVFPGVAMNGGGQ